MKVLLASVLVSSFAGAQDLTLETWRKKIVETNPDFKALNLKEGAQQAQLEEAGDIALSPYLILEANRLDSQKPAAMPQQQGTQTITKNLSLGVSKAFTTGTQAKVFWLQEFQDIRGTAFPFQPAWTGSLGVELQQSLWKNMFGRQIRLRHERETYAMTLAKLSTELERQQKWAGAEEAYWNWIQQGVERQIRAEDLKRSEDLRTWMKDQVSRSLSTESDFLQVEALLMARRLATKMAENEWLKALEQMKLYDPTFDGRTPVPKQTQWSTTPSDRIGGAVKQPIAAKLKSFEAKVNEFQSQENNENLDSDLSLVGRYMGHKRNPDLGETSYPGFSGDRDTLYFGAVFSLNLDRGAVSKLRASYRATAEASKLLAQKAKTDGDRAWLELVRTYKDLQERSLLTEQLWKVQSKKAERERGLLKKGRTSTFQLVNFEQDQSEAQIRYIQHLIGLRRLEAQSLLFTSVSIKEGQKL